MLLGGVARRFDVAVRGSAELCERCLGDPGHREIPHEQCRVEGGGPGGEEIAIVEETGGHMLHADGLNVPCGALESHGADLRASSSGGPSDAAEAGEMMLAGEDSVAGQ